jgi:hypothetical protein
MLPSNSTAPNPISAAFSRLIQLLYLRHALDMKFIDFFYQLPFERIKLSGSICFI